MQRKLVFGCIADDFTGASDAASFLAKGGMKTVLYNGIPDEEEPVPEEASAAVIALKTRTEETEVAVEQSLKAADWLAGKGAEQLYIKYCSTFDSTPEGNIGPVCDAFLERYGIPYTVLCPSLPVNKRTVKNGRIFVDRIPLAESGMRNHPLNPMWDSDIPRLMEEQSKYPCMVLGSNEMVGEKLGQKIKDFSEKHEHFYLVPDFTKDSDGEEIVRIFGELPLLTGGSGLLQPIAGKYSRGLVAQPDHLGGEEGPAFIVAGSCSAATREQIRDYLEKGGFGIMVCPEKLLSGEQTVEILWEQIMKKRCPSILVYTEENKDGEDGGNREKAALLENTLAELAGRAVKAGYVRLICAGGETSGAVTRALGYQAYRIGESVAPGVPVMSPLQQPEIRLVLKSGNFGQRDFFSRALELTSEGRKWDE